MNIGKKISPWVNEKVGSQKKIKPQKNSPRLQTKQPFSKKNLTNNSHQCEKVPTSSDKSDTPVPGRKFFKSKSPASASKCLGSVIINKGFNLKFLPKRRSLSNLPKESPSANMKGNKTKDIHSDSSNSSRKLIEVFDDSSEKDVVSSFDSGIDSKLSGQSSHCSPKKPLPSCSPAKAEILRSKSLNSPDKKDQLTPVRKALQRGGSPRRRSNHSNSPYKRMELTPTKTCRSPTKSPRLKSRQDCQRSPRKTLNSSPTKGSQSKSTPSNMNSETHSPNMSETTVSVDGSADLFMDSNKNDDMSESGSERSGPSMIPSKKYFPIFTSASPASSSNILSGKSLRFVD